MEGVKEQNLANLYRPTKFGDVVGQSTAVETLRRIACADGIAARAVFLRGAYGSGKCIGGWQRVSMWDGYRRIMELSPDGAGDGFSDYKALVEQSDGSYVSTSHFYKEDRATLYSIRGESGCVYTGTAAHPVMAYRYGSGRVELVRVGDLRVGDYIARRWNPSIVKSLSLLEMSAADVEAYVKLGMWYGGVYGKPSASDVLIERGWSTDLSFGVRECVYSSRVHSLLVVLGLASEVGSLTKSGKLLLPFVSEEVGLGIRECLDYLGLVYSTHSKWTNAEYLYRSERLLSARPSMMLVLDRASTHLLYNKACEWSWSLMNVMRYMDEVWDTFKDWLCGGERPQYRRLCRGFDLGVDCEYLTAMLRGAYGGVPKKERSARFKEVQMIAQNMSLQSHVSSESLEIVRSVLEPYGVSLCEELESFCDVALDKIESIDSEVTTVYDLSVPSTHLFYSCGVMNHNTTLSRIMGKAMNCSRLKKEGDVCDECSGCREGSSAVSNTYWELDGTVVGNVEGIRTLRERLQLVPDGRRVVVLDEVQASSTSSMNALLKLVEEGIPNTMFIFSGTEDILPTLKSRCVNIDISTIPLGVIEEYIGKVASSRGLSMSGSELSILAAKSQGHMRDALQLLQYYELIGSAALDTSYFKLRNFVASCFSRSGQHNPEELLDGVLCYPIVDIKYSIGLFLRTIFSTKDESSLEFKFRRGKLGDTLFKFFFNPQAQSALQSELGVEVLLRSLIEKTSSMRSHD